MKGFTFELILKPFREMRKVIIQFMYIYLLKKNVNFEFEYKVI